MTLAACRPDLWPWLGLAALVATAFISAGLILAMRPLLLRHALAHPNARSAHSIAIPQGGGIAVIAAVIAVASATIWLGCHVTPDAAISFWSALTAAGFLTALGIADDIRAVPVVPRLALQSIAVAAVVFTLPHGFDVIPFLPEAAERTLLFVGGLWFVNLVNFMDGIDWMTVAAMVPTSTGLVLLGLLGALPDTGTLTALALLGALIGFAPFNRPVARLFLGDAGSLPIGLLIGWLLALVAGRSHLAAALLLPLYYIADATLTLLRRLRNGEHILAAHRTHYYQRAVTGGFTVPEVVTRVFCVNLALAALAILSVLAGNMILDLLALACGVGLVLWLLVAFARGKR